MHLWCGSVGCVVHRGDVSAGDALRLGGREGAKMERDALDNVSSISSRVSRDGTRGRR